MFALLFNSGILAIAWEHLATPGDWFWWIFGLCGNAVFASRFFLQWIHSERKQQSEVPEYFWWISIVGVIMLFLYFLHLKNTVGLLGNGPQLLPYIRNLMLVHKRRRQTEAAKSVVAVVQGSTTEQP